MSGVSKRRPLAEMQQLAQTLRLTLADTCERIEIAGSVRRGRADVGDIEIVAVQRGDSLTARLDSWLSLGTIRARTSARGNRIAWGDKYRALIWYGLPVDVFITKPEQWGLVFLIRTGPGTSELGFERWQGGANQFLVTQRSKGGLLPDEMRVDDGWLWRGDQRLPTPEESDVFAAMGLPFVEPGQRSISEYKRLLHENQREAPRPAARPRPMAAPVIRTGIARDYWLTAPSQDQVRTQAGRLLRESGSERDQVESYLDYRGEQGAWIGCVTVWASDHDPLRAAHEQIAFGGRMALLGADARSERMSYTEGR